MNKLRKEAATLNIKGRSKMSRPELLDAIKTVKQDEYYTVNIHSNACLNERLNQRLIDKKLYLEKIMENEVRRLSFCRLCEYGKISYEDGICICVDCGSTQQSVSVEGDYGYHAVKNGS